MITIQEYQNKIWGLIKTSIRDGSPAQRELYLVSKLCNESTELLDGLYKRDTSGLTDGALNLEKALDESGDILWYIMNLYTAYGIPVPHFFDFVKRADNYVDPSISLVCQTGEYLGTICKEYYHGKTILPEVRYDLLNDSYALLLKVISGLNLTLEKVMEYNLAKLDKRHGAKYNEKFYKS